MSSELVDEWFKESPPGYVRLAELMMEREGLMMLVLALVLLLEPPQSKPRTGIQPDRTYPVSYTPLQASTASGASSEATDTELEPLTPRESIRWFLNSKKRDVSPESIDRYDTKLTNFEKYCELSSISNVNSLTGRDIERYRTWRRDESTSGALKPKTMRDEMYLFRDFIRYLE